MAEHDSSEIVYEFDNASNTLVDITALVLSTNGIQIQCGTDDDWTPLGATLSQKGVTALNILEDVTLTLKYDDAVATGSWALFGGATNRRRIGTFKVTYFAGGPTRSIEAQIMACNPVVENGKKHRLQVQLINTSSLSET